MKKILFLFATVLCAIVACDPVHEDINNGNHITADELKAMTTVSLDKDKDGKNGNVITCSTSAPINAVWEINGKTILGNYASKKLPLPEGVSEREYTIVLKALCADGTVVKAEYPVTVQSITNPLVKTFIYGNDGKEGNMDQFPFKPAAWNAANMRFSDNEGGFVDTDDNDATLPYLSDDIYWGFKTLIFDIQDATPDCSGRIMNGWWGARYDGNQDVKFTNGLWELPITEAIAKDCARGGGGSGKDLDIMLTSGSCQINCIYYEE